MTLEPEPEPEETACIWCGCSVYVARSRFVEQRTQVVHGHGDVRCDRYRSGTYLRYRATIRYVIEIP